MTLLDLGWGACDVACIHNPAITCANCPPRQATRAGDAALFDAYMDAPDQATRDQARAALQRAGYVDQVTR